MKTFLAIAFISLAGAAVANGQGRPIDWPNYGGDAQRTGWEKSDSRITRDNIKDFQLVLKHKVESSGTDAQALTPPVIIGNLISYKGFKELAFVADGSNNIWSIDADLDRLFWKRHIDARDMPTGASSCMGTATPALTPPMTFGAGRPRAAAGARPPAAPAPAPPRPTSPRVGGTGFGNPRSVFVLAGDGQLHQLNSADGSDQFPPLKFIPPGVQASSLTVHEGVVYTATSASCGGPNGVWAINLHDADPKPVSFETKTGSVEGIGGFAVGADGTVFVQTAEALLALSPKDLKLKQSFSVQGGAVTPVVFTWKGREMVVSAGKQGTLYLLDAQSLGGADHKTALYQTSPATSANHGIWGGLSSWEDGDGTRWVLAPLWGPVSSELKAFATSGEAPTGSVVAFKVEEHDGKPVLTPAWVSRDMRSPVPPVITSGAVFVLAAGDAKASTHATLYALDATTGKEIYSTGDQVAAPGNLNGLTVANGRVYFTTNDKTLYAFGVFLER